ncbi:MAG: DNA translocase FtsK 4TM domain-containing protein, partial [Phycisphaerae bacterium]|nr:DNA translocase FtsK 4TM domain-containing protein [Phycisphaerae bacterium]
MARKPSPSATHSGAASVVASVLPDAGLSRRIAWVVASGAWTFAFLALASFQITDWPSHVVSVHNDPAANLLGRMGAVMSYWTYVVVGIGVWIPVLLAGVALTYSALGRPIQHCVVRGIGALLMMLAFSCLHAQWMPSVGSLTGCDAGLFPMWCAEQLSERFGGVGASLLFILALALGAVVAIDEVVFALPQAILRTLSFLDPIWNFDWAGLVATLRSKLVGVRPEPIVIGGGRTGTTRSTRAKASSTVAPVETTDEEEESDATEESEEEDADEVEDDDDDDDD